MLEIIVTEEFTLQYQRLSASIQKKAEKQEKIFQSNPFHPSLHTEKLAPKGKQVWSFRIDKKYRIMFRFLSGRTVLFLTVGPHDWVYRIQFDHERQRIVQLMAQPQRAGELLVRQGGAAVTV